MGELLYQSLVTFYVSYQYQSEKGKFVRVNLNQI